MKITFVIYSLKLGGAERVLATLANFLVSKNFKVTIITISDAESFYPLDQTIKVIPLNLSRNSITIIYSLINNYKRYKALTKQLAIINPDIIVSFMTNTNIHAILAALTLRKRLIFSERTNFNFPRPYIWKLLRRLIYPWHGTLVIQTATELPTYSFVKNKLAIANPLNRQVVKDKLLPIQYRQNTIIAVGRLNIHKRFDVLIHAFAQIKDKQRYQLIIVGEGEERANLSQIITKTKMTQHVQLIGAQKQLTDYYGQAKIFVLSSQNEGFPNVLIEAMANGCACIATDAPVGPKEIITEGQNGLLVRVNDVDDLQAKLQLLINDTQLQNKLSQNAVKLNDIYSLENIAQQWLNLFSSHNI